MKRIKKILYILLTLILSIILFTACAQNNKGNKNANNKNNNGTPGIDRNDNYQKGVETPVPKNPNQDVELTEILLEDENVLNGQIYLKDEWAIGAIILKDEVSEEEAQEIAQRYAELIKDKYNDKRVNVQVILNGENVSNIEL